MNEPSPHEVPMVATPLGELELAAVLRDAHTHVFGEPPTQSALGVAWAQCAEEHGRGRFVWCHNIGNVTAFGWHGDYYAIHFRPGTNPYDDPVVHFRAHDDFIDGARDYWDVLQDRYAVALGRFEAGDPAGAAAALKAKGYFTAPLAPYQRSMVSLFGTAVKHVLPQL